MRRGGRLWIEGLQQWAVPGACVLAFVRNGLSVRKRRRLRIAQLQQFCVRPVDRCPGVAFVLCAGIASESPSGGRLPQPARLTLAVS